MSCELLTGGISKDCTKNIGGIFTTMWITERSNILSYTKSSPGTDITAFNMRSPGYFYAFEFNRGTSNYVESENNDPTTGNTLVTQTITLVLSKREQTKRDVIALLGGLKEMAIVVKDNNGKYWLFGEEDGCILTTNEGGSGTAKTDANNYTLTFVGEESELANEVSEAAIEAVVG